MEKTENSKRLKKIIITSVAIGLAALAITLLLILSLANNKKQPDHVAQGLPAPNNMRVEGNVLHWDSVDKADQYRVYLGDNNDFFSSTTINRLIVNDLDEGHKYSFSVAAVDETGISSEHLSRSVDVTFHNNNDVIAVGIATPQPDINAARTHLEWAPIPNAVGYSVSVNGQEQAQTASPNFRVNELFTGIHQLRVRALGNGYNYAHSQWSSPVHFHLTGQEMAAPFTQINSSTASWTPVSGATSYEVSINGSVTQKSQLTLPLSDLSAGSNSIQVRAINGASHSAWSNTVTHTVQGSSDGGTGNLSSPSILFIGATIDWSAISGAASYDVSVDDMITNQTSTSLPFAGLGTAPGVKRVYVRARNSSGTSGWSNLVRPTVGLAPPAATISGNNLSWAAVQGAHLGYEVCVDGGMMPRQTTTTYGVGGLSTGVHMLSVRALTTTPMSLVSSYSQAVGITVGGQGGTMDAPYIGLVEEGQVGSNIWVRARAIKWNAVSGATGYDVEVDGSTVTTNQPFVSYMANTLSAGNHTVRVRANNGSTTGAWSNQITFDPSKEMDSTTANGSTTGNNLPAPVLGFGGRTFSWNSVTGGVAYELQVNGISYIMTAQSFTLATGLANGAYSVRVRALNNADKLSQWSNVFNLFL